MRFNVECSINSKIVMNEADLLIGTGILIGYGVQEDFEFEEICKVLYICLSIANHTSY